MAMFREDEERMIAAERAARPRWRRWLGRGAKTAFWACALFYVCLLILSHLGGRSDAMRAGLEQCLDQATGMNAHIGYLNHMAFYPLAGADFDDLTLSGPKNPGAIKVGHARVVMRFWDLLRSRAALAAFVIQDLKAAPGALDPRPVAIDRLGIDDTGPVPRLALSGTWGGQTLRGGLDLQRGLSYAARSPAPFTLSLGGTAVQGTASWGSRQSGVTIAFVAAAGHGTLTLRPDGKGQRVDVGLTTPDGAVELHLRRADARADLAGPATLRAGDATHAATLLAQLQTLAGLMPNRPVIRASLTGTPCMGNVVISADGMITPPPARLCVPAMRRFYKDAAIAADGAIVLDGKPVRTPGGLPLVAPTDRLARAIAEEWGAQGDDVVPASMPLTQLLTTQLDRVGPQRAALTHAMLRYLNTDLLCYRTTHENIARRQDEAWDPWLLWFGRTHDVMLAVTDRLQALTQPEEAHTAVRTALEAMGDAAFTVAQAVTAATGSVVLGLAFASGDLTPADAFAAANIDEIYKSEIYNEDLHGKAPNQDKAERTMRADLDAAAAYLALTR